LQTSCADKPIEVIAPAVEEEVKVKPGVLLQRNKEDYYGSLSETSRDSQSSNAHMDSLKVSIKFRVEEDFMILSLPLIIYCILAHSSFCPNEQPECEEPPQARYPLPPPAPPLQSASSIPAQPERTTANRMERVQTATSGTRGCLCCLRTFFLGSDAKTIQWLL